ncbi:hypothetical protein [Nocardioides jishulii]|uniref:Lipoprotein n=1 Tax=Nocardioides jishulii TaxID=2575440 RepID=A0A4U2YVM8_9ACTN|nr:hypothetical protein [Nocardioides jishulii]QCX28305.1 hypothetical protein FCL41_12835 [Nocardioides jishulii]TKI64802.1 hypothetical protein FC770_06735 [Nocardioides jishulii]
MPQRHLRRPLASLAVVLLLAAAGACAEHDDPSTGSPVGTAPGAKETESGPDVPLSGTVRTLGGSPSWTLPEPKGWSAPSERQDGIVEISEKGGDSSLTLFRWKQRRVDDAEGAGRRWLSKYHYSLVHNLDTTKVSDPVYGTTIVASSAGTLEFVSLDVTFTSWNGRRYRSYYVARHIGDHVFALMYTAPRTDWSQETWDGFAEAGLELQV